MPPERVANFVSSTSQPSCKPSACGNNRPLDSLKVLDFGIITAGALAGAVLADLGADILKVESPTYPYPFRRYSDDNRGESLLLKFNGRGKRGLAIDLKIDKGLEQFKTLVAKYDRSKILLEAKRKKIRKVQL